MAILARHQFDATDEAGNILTDVIVEVRREGDGGLAVLYDGRDTTSAGLLGNPFTVVSGKVGFHVIGGAYRVILTKGVYTRTLRYVGIGRAGETDLTANNPKGAWLVGATYSASDLVTHPVGRGQFISLQNGNIGHEPDYTTPGDTAYWMYLGSSASEADPGILLNWNDGNTDTNPGSGRIAANNDTLSLATVLYVSKTTRGGSDIAAFLLALDDSTNTHKGILTFTDPATLDQWGASVTGVTDATGYVKVAITGHFGETSVANATDLGMQFARSGDKAVDGKFSGTEVIETGASRTLTAADTGKTFIANRATAITFNLDPAASLGTDWMVIVKNDNTGTLTIDPSGAETIDGLPNLTFAKNQSAVLSSNGTVIRSFMGRGAANEVEGHLLGLTLRNNASDATNDIDIAVGSARDDTNAVTMVRALALTKRLDAAWAVGSGNGGRDTGSIANTTYHVWLIMRSDTGIVDVLFSTSATAPTMPTSYDYKRRIGSIIRVGGAILGFSQLGDRFLLNAEVQDRASTSAVSDSNLPLTVPNGIVVRPIFRQAQVHGTAGSGITQIASGYSTAPIFVVVSTVAAGEVDRALIDGTFSTDTARNIRIAVTIASGTLSQNITATLGWIDNREVAIGSSWVGLL